MDALLAVVAENPHRGFWKCYDRLRALGYRWNHKALHRVYCALKLNRVRRTKRRVPTRVRVPLDARPLLNDTWAMDFMGDTLYDGRQYRILHVLDEGNREALGTEIDTSLPGERVVTMLTQLAALHGVPRRIRCDNALPALSSTSFRGSKAKQRRPLRDRRCVACSRATGCPTQAHQWLPRDTSPLLTIVGQHSSVAGRARRASRSSHSRRAQWKVQTLSTRA
jgi:hypothetical protein